jgi:hypothetical protein
MHLSWDKGFRRREYFSNNWSISVAKLSTGLRPGAGYACPQMELIGSV